MEPRQKSRFDPIFLHQAKRPKMNSTVKNILLVVCVSRSLSGATFFNGAKQSPLGNLPDFARSILAGPFLTNLNESPPKKLRSGSEKPPRSFGDIKLHKTTINNNRQGEYRCTEIHGLSKSTLSKSDWMMT